MSIRVSTISNVMVDVGRVLPTSFNVNCGKSWGPTYVRIKCLVCCVCNQRGDRLMDHGELVVTEQ